MVVARAFVFVLGCIAVADDAPEAIADIGEVLAEHVVNDIPVTQSTVTASNIMKSMARFACAGISVRWGQAGPKP